MNSALTFAPLVPAFALFALGAVAIAIALLLAIRSPKTAALRILALAAFIAMLANPQMRVSEREPLDDLVIVLTDESGSQSVDDRRAVTADAAQAVAARLAGQDRIEVIQTPIPGEDETRIGEAVQSALGDNPRARIAGVLVVTDGQNSGPLPSMQAPDAPPVHFLNTGRTSERDRKITLINAPRYGVVNEGVSVGFRIDDFGPDETPLTIERGAVVVLRIDGEEVLRENVPIGMDVSFTAPLNRPGKMIIELEASALDGELSTRNNIAVLPISAIRDRLRVLLISGEPHSGERAWRNLLKSDPAIDLVHFTILRPIEKAASDSALERELALIEFPQDELFIEKLNEFDLVIFDRYTYRGVLNAYHFDNIARYVENGGAVLVASGPEFSGYLSLAARRNFSFILPASPAGEAEQTAFRPKLSKDGARHPVTRDLPEQDYWGRWLRIMPVAQHAGRTLMTGPNDTPLLILNRVGAGRVGMIQSDHFWLWARGFDGGGPHAELLRRVSHWLMKEPDLEEEQLSLKDVGGDLVIERRSIEDDVAPVTLTLPEGTTRDISLTAKEPGVYVGSIRDAERGLYRARSGELFAIGEVGLSTTREFENLVSDMRKVAPLAEATGGGVFPVRGAGGGIDIPDFRRIDQRAVKRSGENWAGLLERNAFQVISVRETPAASPLIWLAIIGLSLLGAWLAEGGRLNRRGLKQG
ncbi:MAG: hypothetical protein R3C40_07810 [Parvularculaceae bacterium]